MKNTIIIDAKNSCSCDLVSIVDDGTNSLFLEIHADVSENPILEIDGADVEIYKNVFLYEIDSSYWVGTGTLQFRIVDYMHTGDYFNISKIDDLTGNVYLTQVDNFNYELIVSKPNKTGVPIANDKDLGVVMGGSNVGIRSNGQMYVDEKGMEKITNSEIDGICNSDSASMLGLYPISDSEIDSICV